MVYAQPKICPGEWYAQTSLEFSQMNRLPNLGQTTRPSDNQQQKKTTCSSWTLMPRQTTKRK